MLILLLKLQLQCLTSTWSNRKTLHLCLCVGKQYRPMHDSRCPLWLRMHLQQKRSQNGSHYCYLLSEDKIKGDVRLPVKKIQSKLGRNSVLVIGEMSWYLSNFWMPGILFLTCFLTYPKYLYYGYTDNRSFFHATEVIK